MRPDILFPLFAQVTDLPGIGPRLGKLIAKLAGERVVSLLWHLPAGLVDRRYTPKLAEATAGIIASLRVRVGKHMAPHNPRQPYKVICHDDTGELTLTFFKARADYLLKVLPEGKERLVSGRLERYGDELQMTHPDYILDPAQAAELPDIEPVYPLTAGLTPRVLLKAAGAAIARAPALPEWIDKAYLARQAWPGWRDAVAAAHRPAVEADLLPTAPARQRLAFDELLASQLALALMRASQRRRAGRAVVGDGRLRQETIAALPFRLTSSQEQASLEIARDMALPTPMVRLLQGDVGSGKTVVAFLAMLACVEAGLQAAMMAPTDVLARQHYATMETLARAAGVEIALLTGRDKGKARAALLERLASGGISLIVGTHALFQGDVAFKDLALAVIDEQHRFGVEQRLALGAKAPTCHLLVMTATPIPRTLMMAAYGDMDVSRLTEKPAGRKPVDTRALPSERLAEVVAAVGRALGRGEQVFWVCPLVEESEAIDLAAATERHAYLRAKFGVKVGLAHGRQKAAERDQAVADFAEKRIGLLVATTVIEVGVDIPAASIMVIEHAERFGLSQLHQLRGRVGRSDRPSTCLLLYQAPLGPTAKARIRILRETDDGFRIAEEDLRLRGAGELLGTRQSGLPDFRLADLAVHGDLLAAARDDARIVAETDADLAGPRGEALRTLLYLFERDAAVRTVRSG